MLNEKIIIIGVFTAIIAISLPKILEPYQSYKDFFMKLNEIDGFTHINEGEYEAALFLRHNIDPKIFPSSIVISDYATSYLIRGVTGLNTSASRDPSMSYDDWVEFQQQIRNIIMNPINNKLTEQMNSIMNETGASNLYLALSKRTCWWVQQSDVLEIRYLPLPKNYPFNSYCSHYDDMLNKSSNMHNMFRNEHVSLYRFVK